MRYNDISYSNYKGEILNLDKIQVYHEDIDPNSAVFGVLGIPSVFSAGKHAFFINPTEDLVDTAGVPNRLKLRTQVKAEIIDKSGNRVYFDYPWRNPRDIKNEFGIKTFLDDEFMYGYRGPEENQNGLALALEITDEILSGTGTIILVGELENVPTQWKGTYNARWKKQITIDKNSLNSTRLYFYNKPTVDVSEIIRNRVFYSFGAPSSSLAISGSSFRLYEEGDLPIDS